MVEIIKHIEECSFKKDDKYWLGYDGFKVITNKQTIFVGIENRQSCCEIWGYCTSQDDLTDFDGADLLKVEVVDTALNIKEYEALDLYEPSTMFVNFQTSKGTFQVVMYNCHNGCYGHSAFVRSEQLTEENSL